MNDVKVIDADGHVIEFEYLENEKGERNLGEDLWSKYLSAKHRERKPKIVIDNWGHRNWMFEGRVLASDPVDWCKHFDIFQQITRPGGWDPRKRLADMDAEGIHQAVLYPSYHLFLELLTTDVELNVDMCRAYNDWLADYCSADRKRLRGIAVLPLVDVEESRKELRRAVVKHGFVGAKMPPIVFRKMLDHPSFLPLYADMQELNVPLCVHHGVFAAENVPVSQFERRFPIIQAACFPHDNMLAAAALIYGGVVDRFPKLRIALLESGCSWVPYWMARLEQHTSFREVGYEFPGLEKTVVEHMKSEQFYYHAESAEALLPGVFEVMGDERFVYASDYPHFGDALTAFGEVKAWKELERIPEASRRKVLHDNTIRLYDLDRR